MNWTSGDWANWSVTFLSFCAALASTVAAFKANATAKKAIELQLMEINSTDVNELSSRIMLLADRCNGCIGEDAHIKKDLPSVIEVSHACCVAFELIESSGLSAANKDSISNLFLKMLRPGVESEFDDLNAFLEVNGNNYEGIPDNYRFVQKKMNLKKPLQIPTPRIQHIMTT